MTFEVKFFGKKYSTNKIKEYQKEKYSNIMFLNHNIANINEIKKIFENNKFDLIVHTAGQPSHDWSAKDPLLDFNVNAVGTLNLLELTRKIHQKLFLFLLQQIKFMETCLTILKALKN